MTVHISRNPVCVSKSPSPQSISKWHKQTNDLGYRKKSQSYKAVCEPFTIENRKANIIEKSFICMISQQSEEELRRKLLHTSAHVLPEDFTNLEISFTTQDIINPPISA